MKICSKCGIDKRNDQYYTYYHSTLKKHYTRNVCNECMCKQAKQVKLRIKEQKQRLKEERIKMIEVLAEQNKVSTIVPNAIVEDYSKNPDYKKCTMCEEYKLLDDYYRNKNSGYYHSRCKPCHNEYTNNRLTDYYQTKYETRGGSERVLRKAGEFVDIYQERQTAWLLELIGWSKDGDVWVKPGIKHVVDGKIVWDKIKPKEKQIILKKSRTVITEQDIEKIIELRGRGLMMREIAAIYKCSKTTIGKILINANEK
jgi:hypothetical protein